MDLPFMPGLTLSELFYEQEVGPILAARFPGLVYSAALLGAGSEVLGFDTPQSMDHDWGPRLMLFLSEADHPAYRDEIDQALRGELPHEIHGFPTDMALVGGDNLAEWRDRPGPTDHSVRVYTVRGFFTYALGFDPDRPLRPVDWLSVPDHVLRGLTGGRVFYDGLGELKPLRARLRYYPHDVWLYLLAAQWRRIAQEEAFMGRCGQLGDDLGSRLVAGRLVRDLMRLCFLMERQYAPYIKWLETAFAQLSCALKLLPALQGALRAESWPEREEYLAAASESCARMHNALGVTEPLPAQVSPYHERPFRVIHADHYVDALRAAIGDEEVRALPPHLGSVDQFVDSTDALGYLDRIRGVYGATDRAP